MNKEVEGEVKRLKKCAEVSLRDAALLEMLLETDGITYCLGYGCGIQVTAEPDKASSVLKSVMRMCGTRLARKEFDEISGTVKFKLEHPNGDVGGVVITAGPPTRCKMELVEEDVLVPAKEAHVERRKRYKLTDPACLGGEMPGEGL